MHRALANILSYAFHPLLMTTLLVVVMYIFTPTLMQPIGDDTIVAVVIATFLLTFFIPTLSVGMLKITRSITSMKLERREERVLPFLFIALYYGLATYLFAYKLRLSDVMIAIFAAISTVILLTSLISLRYKISAHAAGAWGMAGFLTAIHFKFTGGQLLWPITISYLLAGAISTARLALDTHSIGEVSVGAALGLLVSFMSIFVFI